MLNDIKVIFPLELVSSNSRLVALGAVGSINPGEPTKQSTVGAVVPLADGDGTTSQLFTGIAASVSTDTVAAAGSVVVITPLPGIVYTAKAKDPTAINTAAKILALQGKRVVYDLTSTVYTVDTAASDASTNGVVIFGGSHQSLDIYFTMATNTTIFGE